MRFPETIATERVVALICNVEATEVPRNFGRGIINLLDDGHGGYLTPNLLRCVTPPDPRSADATDAGCEQILWAHCTVMTDLTWTVAKGLSFGRYLLTGGGYTF